jgi:hypothetical protein
MSNTQTTQGITPEVGKRYVTRGGWVTPPLERYDDLDFPFTTPCGWTFASDGHLRDDEMDDGFDLISEYVEPTGTVTIASNDGRIVDAPPDTFRRDLIARIYVAMVASGMYYDQESALMATQKADTLIEAMEAQP